MSDGKVAGTYRRQIGGLDFRDGQPNNNEGAEYCIAVMKGKIGDDDCKKNLNYLCERPSTPFLKFGFQLIKRIGTLI